MSSDSFIHNSFTRGLRLAVMIAFIYCLVAEIILVHLAIPLTFLLPLAFGEQGIWMAGPVAEVLLLGLTMIVLAHTARRQALRWGLFRSEE